MWFGLAITALLVGMVVSARSCTNAVTGGDLAVLRKEQIALPPPDATRVHKSASLGTKGNLPYIERVYAVPNRQAAAAYYVATFTASFTLVSADESGTTVLTGGRTEGKRRIGVRIDLRDIASGPRLVEPSPSSPQTPPLGTTAFATVVLSTTPGG
jgi:hypothetical protein